MRKPGFRLNRAHITGGILGVFSLLLNYLSVIGWFKLLNLFNVNNLIFMGLSYGLVWSFSLAYWTLWFNSPPIPGPQKIRNLLDHWILCPNGHDYTWRGILYGGLHFFDYPHDYAWEDDKVLCVQCGFRGLYVIGGKFEAWEKSRRKHWEETKNVN